MIKAAFLDCHPLIGEVKNLRPGGTPELLRRIEELRKGRTLWSWIVLDEIGRLLGRHRLLLCERCGEVFLAKRPDRRFCLDGCRKAFKRAVVRDKCGVPNTAPSSEEDVSLEILPARLDTQDETLAARRRSA